MNRLTIILLSICLFENATCLDYDGWLNIKLEHSLNCQEEYCSRGSISLKSIRAGTAVVDQITYNNNHINNLKELAQSESYYTLRTLVTTAESKDVEIVTFAKAEAYLERGLSDVITAWVLPNGEVIAVGLQVVNSSLPDDFDNKYNDMEYNLNTTFRIHYVDQAPVPDTASYIQKLEREREAREKGDSKDNRSFLVKYWMYIVPIAIFVMISGAANPEPAQSAR